MESIPTHRYNFHLPIDRYKRLRRTAIEKDIDMAELANEFIEKGLQEQEELKAPQISILSHSPTLQDQQLGQERNPSEQDTPLDDTIIMIKKQSQRLTKLQDLGRYLKALESVVPEVRYKLNIAKIEAKSGKSIVEMRRERLGMKPVQSSPIYQERQEEQRKQQIQRYIETSAVAEDEREEIIEDEEEIITE
jgi:hypothetical protein